MPGGNRRGPEGAGPRTGRGLGYCSGHDRPGFETAPGGPFSYAGRHAGGRGLGRGAYRGAGYGRGRGNGGIGRGLGRGAGWWSGPGYPIAAPEETEEDSAARETRLRTEIDFLSERLDALKRELDAAPSPADAESEAE